MQVNNTVVAEVTTLKRRLDGLDLVVNGNEKKLKAYIASFESSLQSSSADAAPAAGAQSEAGRSMVGYAAPTATFRDLQTLASISTEFTLSEVQDADGIKA
eukprot:6459477-Amphidinium_carterae.1